MTAKHIQHSIRNKR